MKCWVYKNSDDDTSVEYESNTFSVKVLDSCDNPDHYSKLDNLTILEYNRYQKWEYVTWSASDYILRPKDNCWYQNCRWKKFTSECTNVQFEYEYDHWYADEYNGHLYKTDFDYRGRPAVYGEKMCLYCEIGRIDSFQGIIHGPYDFHV